MKKAILVLTLISFAIIYHSLCFSQPAGLAMGYNGTLLKTTNGGLNWISQSVGTDKTLWSSWFINPNTGWIVGGTYSLTSIILKTTDGGDNWVQQGPAVHSWLTSVYFVNSQTGWIAGSGNAILKTTNGGINWLIKSDLTEILLIESINFINENTGWITGWGGVIKKTTDGGETWFSLSSGTSSSLYTAKFFSDSIGFAAGSAGKIIKTTDGGYNWTQLTSGTTQDIFSLYFINRFNAVAAGNNGIILKTTNGGNNWIQVSSGTSVRLECIDFINEFTGWIVGGYGGNVIFKTTNGGLNWAPQTSGSTQELFCVIFPKNSGVGITENKSEIPGDFRLYQNYPNPFNPSTKIKFDVPKDAVFPLRRGVGGMISLKIFDILGKEISTLVNESSLGGQPGSYEVTWDASAFPSGIYFCKMETGSPNKYFSDVKRMILIK